jgi:hypothetical protein
LGYYVEAEISNAKIIDIVGALKAINALHTPEAMQENDARGGRWAEGELQESWYSWVENPPKEGFRTIQDALTAWNFDYATDEITGQCEIHYDNCEKWGNQDVFWKTVIPFMHNDVCVTYTGEEDDVWEYTKEDGEFHEKTGVMRPVWDE